MTIYKYILYFCFFLCNESYSAYSWTFKHLYLFIGCILTSSEQYVSYIDGEEQVYKQYILKEKRVSLGCVYGQMFEYHKGKGMLSIGSGHQWPLLATNCKPMIAVAWTNELKIEIPKVGISWNLNCTTW